MPHSVHGRREDCARRWHVHHPKCTTRFVLLKQKHSFLFYIFFIFITTGSPSLWHCISVFLGHSRSINRCFLCRSRSLAITHCFQTPDRLFRFVVGHGHGRWLCILANALDMLPAHERARALAQCQSQWFQWLWLLGAEKESSRAHLSDLAVVFVCEKVHRQCGSWSSPLVN